MLVVIIWLEMLKGIIINFYVTNDYNNPFIRLICTGKIETSSLNKSLEYSIINRHLECVELLLSLIITTDITSIKISLVNHLLCECAISGNTECLATLLKLVPTGLDVNIKYAGNNKKTALSIATEMGYLSIVSQLLAQPGIEIDLHNLNRILLLAVYENDIECVRLLLNIPNLNVNITNSVDSGLTSLMIACDKNHIEIVKLLLLSTDTNINALSRRGNVALMFAINKGHDECARLLLENDNIDTNIINQDGEAIITLCANKSCEDIIKILLSKPGLQVNVPSKMATLP